MPDPIALNLARIVHRLLVDPRGWNVDNLMGEFDIADRTYRKYKKLLVDHFQHRLQRDGRLRIDERGEGAARTLILRVDDGDEETRPDFLARVASYWLVREVFGFARDTALSEALEGPWGELLVGIRDKPFYLRHLLTNTDRMLHHVPDAPKDYADHDATISTLLTALFYTRRVAFEYAGGEGTRWKKQSVCPLTLVMWRSALYLAAAFTPEGKVYLYAVERMRSVEPQADRFEYPSKDVYSPKRLFEGSFGIWQQPGAEPTQVELVFAAQPYLQRYLKERTWHPSQQFDLLADGRLRMRFTVRAMVEVWPWVRSFGEDVEVVAPKGTPSS